MYPHPAHHAESESEIKPKDSWHASHDTQFPTEIIKDPLKKEYTANMAASSSRETFQSTAPPSSPNREAPPLLSLSLLDGPQLTLGLGLCNELLVDGDLLVVEGDEFRVLVPLAGGGVVTAERPDGRVVDVRQGVAHAAHARRLALEPQTGGEVEKAV
ncbi:hypothetical protein HYQ46_002168 [Verticillium longisporum]|nr:hypothetical protein HYQ46_002168 [Verticillium longisporum]